MKLDIPNTPFSTRLSGNAKETELRIRSIFQWKKLRPPVWLMSFIVLGILGCGGLVSWKQTVKLPELTLIDGTRVFTRLEEPKIAEEAIDDTVTVFYCQLPDDTEVRMGQVPFGPDHHYWDSLSLKEFQNVLGHSGVVVGYQMGSASYVQEYRTLDGQSAELLAVAQNTAYEVDVDGDGQRELITNYGTLRYLDVFQILDGKVNCCQLNELVRDDLGLDEHIWVGLYYYEDTGLVTATWTNPNGSEENRPLEIADLFAMAEAHHVSGTNNEIRIERDELTGLTLDDNGEGDDNVYIESRIPKEYDMDKCEVELRIVLGSGDELTRTWNERAIPGLVSAHLTDPNRDSVVVWLADMTSNYDAENTYVLDVVDGQLVERLKYSGVNDGYILEQGDAPLDSLRLAQLVNKWHMPEYHTAVWDGKKFSIKGDGFFTDTYTMGTYFDADNNQMELTLSLRGIADEGNTLVYDRVQILNGDTALQTIEPAGYLPQRYYDYDGFLADGFMTYGAVDVRDINFDGYPDFGLLCDNTRNERHAWFVWDPNKCEFTYLAHLGGDLTVDDTVWQLKEVVWDDSFDRQITNYYAVSYTGKLIPLHGAGADTVRFSEEAETFRAALLANKPVYDAMDGQERYIQRIPQESTAENPIFHAEYFSVVDLDRDSLPEVVLWLAIGGNMYYGFDILRYEDGKVVCYSEVYRGLMGLKADGTFSFSSGVSDHGFGRIASFGPEWHEEEKITWCQSADNAFGVEFFVDGRASNSVDFDASLARQDEKPDAVWYEMTGANIDLLGGMMSSAAG